ncbi:unnamed protein product [Closterium sp. NIES-53]
MWSFAVWYVAHQLNLWPRISLPETSPTLRWTGKVGEASVFWVWGSRAFVHDTSADKLSSRAIPCVFLGFPPDVPGWPFYHPTSRRVRSSHDVTFDESTPFYRLFPYRTAPLPPPPPLFLAPCPPPINLLPPQGPAPSEFGAARGGAARGAASGCAEPAGAEPGGAKLASAEPGGAEPEGAKPGGAETEGAEPGGADSKGAESGGAEPREPLSPRQLREWFARHARLRSGAAGAGGPAAGGTGVGCAGATSLGGAGVTVGVGGTGGAGAAGPGGARTRGSGAAGAGGVGGAGAVDPGAGGTGAGGAGAGGTGAGDPRAGGTGAGDPRAGGAGVGGAGAGDPGAEDRGAGGAGAGGVGAGGTGARDPGARGTGARDPGAGGTGAGGAGAGGAGPGDPGAGGAGAGDPGARGTGAGDPGSGGVSAGAGGARAGDPGAGGAGAGDHGARGTGAGDPGAGVMSLSLVLPCLLKLFALVVLFLVRVLLLSPALTLWHFVLPLFHCEFPCRLLLRPLFLTVRTSGAASALVAELVAHVCTGCRVPCPHPPSVPVTHIMALRPSSVPLRVPLPSPHASSIAEGPDPESDLVRATSPTVTRLLATVFIYPSFVSAAASTLVAELVDLAATRRLDYAASLVAESGSDCPPSVGGVKRPPGSPPAFKARYVARGFSQREGVEFFQTFSPTPKMTILRVLLHVAAQRDHELHSLDFSTAFLQGSLHEEMWLRRPPGFTGSFPAGAQWSLRRQVYGIRQAPRKWHNTLRTTLMALGFAPSTADPSLFLRTDTSLPPFYVLLYVDNLVFATADTEALALLKSELLKRHTCTDLGELRSYLGLQITRDRARRTITSTQSHMVHQVLQRFGFRHSLPQSTPLPTGHSLSAPPSDESVKPSSPYPELVGCLMYLITCTRPDLAYPLSIVARYVVPGRHRPEHWEAAKRVLRYLCSTSGMGLVLGGRYPVVLTGHADASWVDDLATQRSSYEAEIYAGAMAAQELLWLTYLLTDLGERPRSSPVLYVDNKAMIALCLEHHIALRYFLARELQQRGQLRLAYVATRANTADIFTKALQSCDHQRFCTILGLVANLPHLLTA